MRDFRSVWSLRRRILLSLAVAAVMASPLLAQTPQAAPIETQKLDPEPIRITIDELPEPFASESAQAQPKIAPVPDDPVLNAPAGFSVNVFAADVPQARWLALTPDGDVLCSSGKNNKIHLLQDTDGDGVADQRHVFLDESRGANLPFGMDFAQVNGQWYFFLGNTNAVLRYPYQLGQTELKSDYKKITALPGQGYNQHWTRNVRVAPDQTHLFVTVGSKTNAEIEELPRASVLRMRLDGSQREVFASGLRNPVGLDFHPQSKQAYVNVNERDKLGDRLVPDYFTEIEKGQFFGWPYTYLAPQNLDPRHAEDGRSVRPELASQTHPPDVLYEAHSAALGLAFGTGMQFPARYRQGAFSALRGSWNRSRGTGYKVVFVPFGDDHRPLGYYEDFLTGFLLEPDVPQTWGRPVGLIFASDGSLLLTEEAHGRIYRIAHTSGKNEGSSN